MPYSKGVKIGGLAIKFKKDVVLEGLLELDQAYVELDDDLKDLEINNEQLRLDIEETAAALKEADLDEQDPMREMLALARQQYLDDVAFVEEGKLSQRMRRDKINAMITARLEEA